MKVRPALITSALVAPLDRLNPGLRYTWAMPHSLSSNVARGEVSGTFGSECGTSVRARPSITAFPAVDGLAGFAHSILSVIGELTGDHIAERMSLAIAVGLGNFSGLFPRNLLVV